LRVLIKLSGKILESEALRCSLSGQIRILRDRGLKILMVHGAGKQLTEYCRDNRIPVVQHHGRRVTDRQALEAAVKVFSSVNREITAALLAAGVKALGVSAFDGNLTASRKRPPIALSENGEKIDFGLVAEIEKVDPQVVETLWSAGFTPVISSLCADENGQILNINADTLAAELAVSLAADVLMSVSDVQGIYLDLSDPDSLITRLSLEDARDFLNRKEVFSDGMIPKIQNAISVLERGIPRYHLVSGLNENSIIASLEGKAGTILSGRISG
jgi:acetylglutamate kinase